MLLTLENMGEILELTWPHRASWKLIGMELGIDNDTLDLIEFNYRSDQGCLHELIYTLLTCRYPYLRLTRATITAVLKSDILPTAGNYIIIILTIAIAVKSYIHVKLWTTSIVLYKKSPILIRAYLP